MSSEDQPEKPGDGPFFEIDPPKEGDTVRISLPAGDAVISKARLRSWLSDSDCSPPHIVDPNDEGWRAELSEQARALYEQEIEVPHVGELTLHLRPGKSQVMMGVSEQEVVRGPGGKRTTRQVHRTVIGSPFGLSSSPYSSREPTVDEIVERATMIVQDEYFLEKEARAVVATLEDRGVCDSETEPAIRGYAEQRYGEIVRVIVEACVSDFTTQHYLKRCAEVYGENPPMPIINPDCLFPTRSDEEGQLSAKWRQDGIAALKEEGDSQGAQVQNAYVTGVLELVQAKLEQID